MNISAKGEYKIGVASERQMGRRSIISGPAHITLFFIVWFVAPLRFDHPFETRFLVGSVLLVSLARLHLTLNQARYYSKRRKQWNTFFNITALWASLNWGILGAVMVNSYGLTAASLVALLTVCGICAGGSSTLFYRPWLARSFIATAILPGVFAELLLKIPESFGTAFVSMAYLSFLLIQIEKSYQTYWDSLVNQESALDQRNKLQAALQGSLDSVFFLTACRDTHKKIIDFTITEVNKKAEEKSDSSRAKLIGSKILEAFPSYRSNGLFERYVQVLETRQPIDEELSIQDSEHGIVWLQHQIIPQGDGVVITSRNISEKAKTIQALKHQQDQLAMVLNASKLGTWEWDPKSRKFQYSDSLISIYDFDKQPNERESFIKAIHSTHRHRVEVEIKEALDSCTSYSIEFPILCKGVSKWIHEIGHPICDKDGAVICFTGLSKDVSQRKDAEHIIEEQKLKISAASKLAALGEMAGGIAHEINNPLASIRSISQLIEKLASQDKLNFPMAQSFTRQIGEIVDRVAETVKGLRTFSREADDDIFETVSAQQILDETFRFCKAKFERNDVNLVIESDSKEIKFDCRKTQICQALLCLLNNAFDAIEKEKDKWIKVVLIDNTDFVQIAVVDSGLGIPERLRDKIMMPFFTTKEVGKGTGLGLSVSKGIVESHSGALTLDTASPNTRFVIQIPKKQPMEKMVA